MPPDDNAPPWVIPLLAALLVLRSGRHHLRSLDDSGFQEVARGCDRFLLATTVPGFALSALLLPAAAGGWILLATSMWGIVVMLLVGRRVALALRKRSALTWIVIFTTTSSRHRLQTLEASVGTEVCRPDDIDRPPKPCPCGDAGAWLNHDASPPE